MRERAGVAVSVYEAGRDAPVDACLAITQALPDYFTASALPHIRDDLTHHAAYVLQDQARRAVIGFAVVARKNAVVAELLWLAVERASQGQGHGSALLAAVEERLRADGVTLLEVKTLAPTVVYAPYERTRHFYERAGFVLLEVVDPYPGWEPDSPCAIYVKILAAASTL